MGFEKSQNQIRCKQLKKWAAALEAETPHWYRDYISIDKNGRRRTIKSLEEFNKRGCYVVYRRNTIVYVGSINEPERTIKDRVIDNLFGGNHALTSRLIDRHYGEGHNNKEEWKSHIKKEIREWYLAEFYFKYLEEAGSGVPALIMEKGLIFLLNPQYNYETPPRLPKQKR